MYTLAAADALYGLAGTASAITYSVFGMTLSSATGNESYMKLAQGQLSASAVALYTTPGLTTAFLKNIVLCNTTSSIVNGIVLYASGSASSNQLTNISIPANGQAIIDDYGVKVYDSNGSLQTGAAGLFDTTLPTSTTPGVLSTTGTAATAARRDHTHASPGGIASLTAATSAISNTETNVISVAIPANLMQLGTTYRILLAGQSTQTSAAAANLRVRIGTANNSSDNIAVVITPTSGTTGTGVSFYCEFLVTVYATGTSGSAAGGGWLAVNSATGTISNSLYNVVCNTTPVTVNTTVQNYIHVSFQSGASANTATFYLGVVEIVKM
jgi:hypothetical protein